MSKKRNKAVTAVYLFLRKDKNILLMRRQGSGYYDSWYSIPAGHVEAGELPLAGLIREIKEEIGVDIDPKATRLAHTMYRTKHDETGDRLDLFFETNRWKGEPQIIEPHKCDAIDWFSIEALPDKMMHHVKDALDNIEKGIIYSELGRGDIVLNPNNP